MFNLYNHIKKLALNAGYPSVKQFCISAGVSPSTMTELRKGRAQNISNATAEKFAAALNVTIDEVYGRTFDEEQIKAAFWGGESELTPEDIEELWQETKDYVEYKTLQRKKKK